MIDYKEQQKDQRWAARSREIMERDNFTCQLCGKKHVKLNVHHIKYNRNLNYWEYPDELLLTVCEVCHAKIHGKKVIKRNRKGVVFYNCLFSNKNLKETTDKIILSYLCYKSIDGNGTFVLIKSKIAKDLKMSTTTINERIKRLSNNGFISIEDKAVNIKNLEDIKNSFYFELLIETKLKGEKLIVYSYLKNKSKNNNNIISTFDKIQAKEFGLSKKHYQKILCELYKAKFIERLPNGRLKIN